MRKRIISLLVKALLAITLVAAIVFVVISWRKLRYDADDNEKIEYTIKPDEEAENKPLENKCIVVDAGHGGIDPGKVSEDELLEKDINLEIAKKLITELENQGARVVPTRLSDDGLYSDEDKNKKLSDMRRRAQIINNANADMTISIHQNSFPNKGVHGAQVFYYKTSKNSQEIARCVQKVLNEELGNNKEAAANGSYYILKQSDTPTIIVECGFLTNEEEASRLVTDEYQLRIVEMISRGVIEYYSNKDSQG